MAGDTRQALLGDLAVLPLKLDPDVTALRQGGCDGGAAGTGEGVKDHRAGLRESLDHRLKHRTSFSVGCDRFPE